MQHLKHLSRVAAEKREWRDLIPEPEKPSSQITTSWPWAVPILVKWSMSLVALHRAPGAEIRFVLGSTDNWVCTPGILANGGEWERQRPARPVRRVPEQWEIEAAGLFQKIMPLVADDLEAEPRLAHSPWHLRQIHDRDPGRFWTVLRNGPPIGCGAFWRRAWVGDPHRLAVAHARAKIEADPERQWPRLFSSVRLSKPLPPASVHGLGL